MNRLPLTVSIARLAAAPLIAILILWGDNEFYIAGGPVTMWVYGVALALFLASAAADLLDYPVKATAPADLVHALHRAAGLALTVLTLLALCKTSLPFDLSIAAILIIGRDIAMVGLREGLGVTGSSMPAVEGAKLQAVAVLLGVGCALAAQTLVYFSLPLDVIVWLLWIARGALWAGAALALITGALYVRRAFAKPAA